MVTPVNDRSVRLLATSPRILTVATARSSLFPPLTDSGWSGASLVVVTDGSTSNNVRRGAVNGYSVLNHPQLIAIEPGRRYRARFWARAAASTSGLLYMDLQQFLAYDLGQPAPNNGGRAPYKPLAQVAHTDWRVYDYVWDVADWQAGAKFIRPDFLLNYRDTGTGYVGYWEVQDFTFTDVTDILLAISNAATAVTNAQNALDIAAAANVELGKIANDNILSKGEKGAVKADYDAIVDEKNRNITQATALGVSTTAYASAYSALNAYMAALSPLYTDFTQDTTIDGALFRSYFATYYTEKVKLLNAIAAEAANRAAWGTVSGRPANIANLIGTESINNALISLGADGSLGGAGGGQATLSGMGMKNWRVVAMGAYGGGAVPVSSGLYLNGSMMKGSARSYMFARINRSTNVITFDGVYDVFGSGQTNGYKASDLAAALNATGPDSIAVVWTYDEPRNNRTDSGLDAAMLRCGASRACFGSPNFKYHGAYILVGVGGCGEGNGAEAYQGAYDDDPNAWCDLGFSIVNGQLTGVSSSFTPKTLADYNYTGSLQANYTAANQGIALNDDPMFEAPSDYWDWTSYGAGITLGTSKGSAGVLNCPYLQVQGGIPDVQAFSKRAFPIDPLRTYSLSANVYAGPNNARTWYLITWFFDKNGNGIASGVVSPSWGGSYTGYPTSGQGPASDTWQRFSGRFGFNVAGRQIPPNAVSVRVGFWFNNGGSGTATQAFQDMRLIELTTDWTGMTGPNKPADNATADMLFLTGNATVVGNKITGRGTESVWNASAYSKNNIQGSAYCEFTADYAIGHVMAGLTVANPGALYDYTDLSYAIYLNSGSIVVYESNSPSGPYGSYGVGDSFSVHSDGTRIYYAKNGTVFKTTTIYSANLLYYFDSSFYENGISLSGVKFIPYANKGIVPRGNSSTPDNVFPDPLFRDLAFWNRLGATIDDAGDSGGGYWRYRYVMSIGVTGEQDTITERFPMTPGATYSVTYQLYSSGDFNGKFTLALLIPGDDYKLMGFPLRGNWPDGFYINRQSGDGSPAGGQSYTAQYTFPNVPGSNYAVLRLRTLVNAGFIQLGSVTITRVTDAALLAPGAVTDTSLGLAPMSIASFSNLSAFAVSKPKKIIGTVVAVISNGKAPYNIAWSVEVTDQGDPNPSFTIGGTTYTNDTCTLYGIAFNSDGSTTTGVLRCTVTDVNGRSATQSSTFSMQC